MTLQRFGGFSHGKNRRAPLRAGQAAKPAPDATGYALCHARHGNDCSCETQGMRPCVTAVAEVLGK